MSSINRKSKNPYETPPESFVNGPPTPPLTDSKPSNRIEQVLHIIRRRKAGRVDAWFDQPWYSIRLQAGEYEEIQRLLEADEDLWGFYEDKVRLDYFARSNKLVFRMPTILHESFGKRVSEDITQQLRLIAAGVGPSAEVAANIYDNGSPRLVYEDGDAHEPDMAFYHTDAKWPGIIIEVSYSQKRRDLPKLADGYILESNSSTRLVIGLDIEYSGGQAKRKRATKQASISMWRPEFVENSEGGQDLLAIQTITDLVS
jgi:hypothetical protein